MSKKLRAVFGISLALLLFFMVACSPVKSVLSKEDFVDKMEQQGYEVQDFSRDTEGLLEASMLASNDKGLSVEFYITLDKEQAIDSFEDNKLRFEENKTGTYSQSSNSGLNYKKYELTTNGRYMAVCQVDTTVLFLSVEESLKPDVQQLLKDIGY